MDDGRILKEEFDATSSKKETTDPMLKEKFNDLTAGALTGDQQSELYDFAMNLEQQTTLEPMLQLLKELPVIH